MNDEKYTVVIIGGGITGITAAYYLQKAVKERQLPIECKLVEATHRLGGKVQTVVRDGFVIERGPDSFLARKTSAFRLVREVGLENEIVHNATGKSYILVNGKLYPIPGGAIMGIPTQIGPFITTRLFSPLGKLRAAFDFILPPTKAEGDLSLGQFFRRRLGDEVVDNLIEPLLSGIYAGDIDQMSLMATFPQFFQIEQKYGSLVLGAKRTAPKAQKERKGAFQTLKTGLQSLVDEVEKRMEQGSVIKGVRVERVWREGTGYRLRLSNGDIWKADSIIVAAPHSSVPAMFADYPFFEPFQSIPSTSVATVALAFPESAIEQDIDGTGFVVSRRNDYTITACTWTHKKWPHTAPDGKALLRCYVGRPGDEEIVEQSDDEIVRVVMDDLSKIMRISGRPELIAISRWKEAMPQYTVGHKERLAKIKTHMDAELPGVFLAGSSYEGLGLPDCIDQGENAVKKVLDYLQTAPRKLAEVNSKMS
ncbi:protoporphyrinogen oxidase [Parageobacillus thermoglucosidasius]|uniref:Coproporphyrinogen III oxidase n=1 Tax=Parageobacillus thermoglucosidasius TaxID=1426 RepID=A0AAN0YMG8_PARTM|nr:protoporphyrinogen oxidase [Parageobacillus thermoglucosidasius]KYD15616.1 Protoporphyrinogen IX oxidase, aerobic, HemY [Anoxybacillus flavithermus]REK57718.1 MAG: protoporphyrinogen oxidase [Geobacillus sp.]ALF09727.1 protoporphyrinogen oxidase [Parageobacillus thermoglucosidasius]ANZ29807.1 protoporphyrinogen oxidase [Parageobacillus thermoglucosidasius]APM80545.1 protoporphyrinogen oxidase [Parageobacillus thermoglucosidasius]